jgi:thiol-disulfide isomerase/thioredoxin
LLGVETAAAVDVAQELNTINTKFQETMKGAADKRAVYPQASAERKAALEKLAATAEAEKSTEHRVLSQIYLSLNRNDDAVRQANAALSADANDFAARSVLISALSETGKAEQAAESLQILLSAAVDEKNAVAFLHALSNSTQTVVRAEATAERFDAAERLIEQYAAKVGGITVANDPRATAKEQATRATALMKTMISTGRVRAALIGQAYSPLENPTWLNGAPISPQQLHGKVVLLDFWAVWCGPCIATFPELTALHDKYADKGLVIIGVTKRHQFGWNAEEKRPEPDPGIDPAKEDAATTEFAKHHGLKHRLAVMPDQTAFQKYGIFGIPQVVVIDQNGIVRLIRVGAAPNSAHEIEAEIRKLLGLSTVAATK